MNPRSVRGNRRRFEIGRSFGKRLKWKRSECARLDCRLKSTAGRIPWRLRTSERWLVSSPKSHYGKLYAPVATVALRRQPADGGPVVWPLGNKNRYPPRRPLHRIPARFGDKNKKRKQFNFRLRHSRRPSFLAVPVPGRIRSAVYY